MENSDRYAFDVSQQTIISVASSKSKNTQLSREALTVQTFLPEELLPETQNLIKFFREYYQWMNQEFLSISSDNESHQVVTSRNSNSLYLKRSPDSYYRENQSEAQMLFDEVARNLPKNTAIDFRTVLKHIISLYNQKGSEESVQSFFRILYDISASVYYPWDDVLIASDGKWDGEKFITNDGFLSDRIHLQDSNYWQRFSYDIKVGAQEYNWRDVYEALIHPSGFKFFASFILILFAEKRYKQIFDIILMGDLSGGSSFKIFLNALDQLTPIHIETILEITYLLTLNFLPYIRTFNQLTFYNSILMEEIDDKTLDEIIINTKKYNISSDVTIVQIP